MGKIRNLGVEASCDQTTRGLDVTAGLDLKLDVGSLAGGAGGKTKP